MMSAESMEEPGMRVAVGLRIAEELVKQAEWCSGTRFGDAGGGSSL